MRNDPIALLLARRAAPLSLALLGLAGGAHALQGELFTLTNSAAGNAVAVYDRDASGALSFDELVPTGGLGTGAGLGNQGALALTDDGRFLLAVNAGSDDLTVFRVEEDALLAVDLEPSRGLQPISVAAHDDLVFVVNAGSDSIAGFRLSFDGDLEFLGGSVSRLSAQAAGPAQIGFGPRGDNVYVTEKATNKIVRYALGAGGQVLDRTALDAPGMTPFGFAFGLRNQLFVSEAAGGAPGASTLSSLEQLSDGLLQTISGSVPTTQAAACWVALTPDGRFAYTTNTADDSISSFGVAFDGSLALQDAQAALTGDGPIDLAITRDSRFLYVLTGADGQLGAFAVAADGVLAPVAGGPLPPLAPGASGLAVR